MHFIVYSSRAIDVDSDPIVTWYEGGQIKDFSISTNPTRFSEAVSSSSSCRRIWRVLPDATFIVDLFILAIYSP